MTTQRACDLRITIAAASGLHKSDYFRLPDPFAILAVDSEEAYRTAAHEKALSPHWNETFMLTAKNENIITIRVFEHKKFQKKEQGFLGVVKFQVRSVLDLAAGGDERITRDLQISRSGRLVAHGNLTVQLSTNLMSPIFRQPQNNGSVTPSLHEKLLESSAIPPAGAAQGSQNSLQINSSPAPERPGGTTPVTVTPYSTGTTSFVEAATSEEAKLAWSRRFSTPQVHLERNDPAPFSTLRRLGGGGMGIVFETKLDGISLALKRTYTRRRLTDYDQNEIKILSQITENRHKHIVELIGSYIHNQRGVIELGLLIWPVAHCDLAVFMQDIDSLSQSLQHSRNGDPSREEGLDSSVIESLSALTGTRLSGDSDGSLDKEASHLLQCSMSVLRSSFGCIANAVAWLHQQGIRHKDLKPSQVLLSLGGLWLTDFGWSKDISDQAHSATTGGDTIALKYQSPERAELRDCGRPEDIFGLGCTFVEMTYQLAKPILPFSISLLGPPWKKKGWAFQAHLDELQRFMAPISGLLDDSLPALVARMLSEDPDHRPLIEQVVTELPSSSYFGKCCCPPPMQVQYGLANHQRSQSGFISYLTSIATQSKQSLSSPATQPPTSANDCQTNYQPQPYVPKYNASIACSTMSYVPAVYNPEQQLTQAHVQPKFTHQINSTTPSSLTMYTPNPIPDIYGKQQGSSTVHTEDYIRHYPSANPPPQYVGQSPAPSTLSSNVASHSSSNLYSPRNATPTVFSDPAQNSGYGSESFLPQRVSSFGPTTSEPSKENWKALGRVAKTALAGLDHQINGIINDNRTRGFIAPRAGPPPTHPSGSNAGWDQPNATK